MDKNKNVSDDQTSLEDMPQTGGDVVANEQQTTGQKGGEAAQQKQENESYNEFKQNEQTEESDKSEDSEDLFGQE